MKRYSEKQKTQTSLETLQ